MTNNRMLQRGKSSSKVKSREGGCKGFGSSGNKGHRENASQSNETARGTESRSRRVKEGRFCTPDCVAVASTVVGLGSTAFNQLNTANSWWSSVVFATGSAWCAFLASFVSTRQGFADVRQDIVDVRQDIVDVRQDVHTCIDRLEKLMLQAEIRNLQREADLPNLAEGTKTQIENLIESHQERIREINEVLHPRAAGVGYEDIYLGV